MLIKLRVVTGVDEVVREGLIHVLVDEFLALRRVNVLRKIVHVVEEAVERELEFVAAIARLVFQYQLFAFLFT